MIKRIAHFKKGVIFEHPDAWIMIHYDGELFKFAKCHYSVKEQLEEFGFKSVIITTGNDEIGIYHLVGIDFKNKADEAEFIMKYYDTGIEIKL